MSRAKRFIIIGAGQAGGEAAVTLREAGFDGDIALVGEEALPPYERPPLSKAYLIDAQAKRQEFRPLGAYRDAGVECRLGQQALSLDTDARTLDLGSGERLRWDRLLLATGGSPRRLRHTDGPVHYLRTENDAVALRERLRKARRIVVIGGGVIGLEVASSARQLGAEVTVVEPGDRVMARMIPPDISRLVEQLHRDAGVDLRLGTSAHWVEAGSRGDARVYLANGHLPADLVCVGIGIVPNTQLAEAAGLDIDNGIVVDATGRTSHPDVFAAGDVANAYYPRYERHLRMESWQNANRQARGAAHAMCGEPIDHDRIPWFWTDQYRFNVQVAGVPALADRTIFRGERDPATGGVTAFHLSDNRVVAATTINNPRDMGVARRLLERNEKIDSVCLTDTDTPLKQLLK